jgi:ribosomal protein L37E
MAEDEHATQLKCERCGQDSPDTSLFCTHCGRYTTQLGERKQLNDIIERRETILSERGRGDWVDEVELRWYSYKRARWIALVGLVGLVGSIFFVILM